MNFCDLLIKSLHYGTGQEEAILNLLAVSVPSVLVVGVADELVAVAVTGRFALFAARGVAGVLVESKVEIIRFANDDYKEKQSN